jgi:pimeloyl-ACP methyl ester carboxylesterase
MKNTRLYRLTLPLMAWTLAAVSGCATPQSGLEPKPGERAGVVLVHGAFQDARAWDDVVPLLRAKGLKVVTVNLPGRASAGSAVETATLDAYRSAVLAAVQAQEAPVVLVGHSFGGITISSVAEAVPQKIRTLVYVAAYLPKADAADQSMAKMAETDQWNRFNKQRQNFMLAKDYKTAWVLEDDRLAIFCDPCSPALQARTLTLMQAEPLAPASTPVQLTAARFGQVDKVYVHTKGDHAVSYQLQQRMVEATPVRKVVTLDTGHQPYLEAPQALADAIAHAAAK